MKDLYFENQGSSTYLVCEISDSDVVDSLSLGMLTNNKIPGLSDTLYTQMDSAKLIKYNVSAKVSVKQFFTGTVNKKRLLGVFSGIVDAMLSAQDYMIDTNTIILDTDYIFADVSTCETVLLCLPIIKEDNSSTELGVFFKNIMFNTQFDQTEKCDHIAKLIHYLNSTPVFILADFKALLISIQTNESVYAAVKTQPSVQHPVQPQFKDITMSQPSAVTTKQTTVQSASKPSYGNLLLPQTPMGVQPTKPQAPVSLFYLLQHYNKENAAIYKQQKAAKKAEQKAAKKAEKAVSHSPAPQKKAKQKPADSTTFTALPKANFAAASEQPVYQQPAALPSQPMNFGETTVLGGGNNGETTVLNEGQQSTQIDTPHLLRAKNNEKSLINKPVFRIGKERSYVDYFIADNAAISRSQANIISRDGKYFLVDTNSTNHTYLNGQMVQSNSEAEIKHGDKICLANEEFEFKIY